MNDNKCQMLEYYDKLSDKNRDVILRMARAIEFTSETFLKEKEDGINPRDEASSKNL